MKKLLLLMLLLCCSFVAKANIHNWEDESGFTWQYQIQNSDNTAVIVECWAPQGNIKKISIPTKVYDSDTNTEYKVTTIGIDDYPNVLWVNCLSVIEVIVPEGVTAIGDMAFAGSYREFEDEEYDEFSEYYTLPNLEKVTLPSTLKTIGEKAFYKTKLSSISLPEGLETIKNYAFINTSLKSITIPASVKEIGYAPLMWCPNLEEIKVASGNKVFNTGNYNAIIKGALLISGCKNTIIPSFVTEIGGEAFSHCYDKTSIVLPEGLIKIGSYAFKGTPIESVTIPASCRVVDGFAYCPNINKIYCKGITPPDMQGAFDEIAYSNAKLYVPMESVNKYQFNSDWDKFYYIQGIKNLDGLYFWNDANGIEWGYETEDNKATIISCSIAPQNNISKLTIPSVVNNYDKTYIVKTIGNGQSVRWENCNVKEIIIPEGVELIRALAFFGRFDVEEGESDELLYERRYCLPNLTKVSFPSSLKTINAQAFYCTKITNLDLPEGLETIGSSAFPLSSVKSIYIPSTVKNIHHRALDGCYDLAKIVIAKNNPIYSSGENCNAIMKGSHLMIGCKNTTVPDNITHIDEEALDGLTLKSIILPKNLQYIGDWAFAGSVIEYINIPNNTIFGIASFEGSSINTLEIEDGLKKIENAFEYSQIKTINCHAKTPPALNSDGFNDIIYKNTTLYVPIKSLDLYKNHTYWKKFDNMTGVVQEGDKFKITYVIDGVTYKEVEMEYGANITPEPAPEKEGYTFSGWNSIPTTMPADDIIVTGSFSINQYRLIYIVDGEIYASELVDYSAAITPVAAPEKEGYTFSGWSTIPATMPAEDITITGSFTVNQYKITYLIGDVIYMEEYVDYGAVITPPQAPEREGFDFTWIDLPETMPAHNITIIGGYTSGIETILAEDDVEWFTIDGTKLDAPRPGVMIAKHKNGKTQKVYIKRVKK